MLISPGRWIHVFGSLTSLVTVRIAAKRARHGHEGAAKSLRVLLRVFCVGCVGLQAACACCAMAPCTAQSWAWRSSWQTAPSSTPCRRCARTTQGAHLCPFLSNRRKGQCAATSFLVRGGLPPLWRSSNNGTPKLRERPCHSGGVGPASCGELFMNSQDPIRQKGAKRGLISDALVNISDYLTESHCLAVRMSVLALGFANMA